MRLMFVTALMLLVTPCYSMSEETQKKESSRWGNGRRISFWVENDFFTPFQKDRWYSNGFGMDLETSDSVWGVRHEMYTPKNKRAESIVEDDRPYDGELSLVYLRKLAIPSVGSGNRTLLFGGKLGCLGDCAKAKRLQKFVHNDGGFGTDPRGWDNQNPSEPLVNFLAYYRHQSEGPSIFGQMVREETTWGAEVGTEVVKASLRTELEQDIAYGVFGLIDLEGTLVGHNTHLDGRVFRENVHTVESIPFVASAGFGLGYRAEKWEVRYRYEYQTEEFKGQEGRHLFGAVTFTKNF